VGLWIFEWKPKLCHEEWIPLHEVPLFPSTSSDLLRMDFYLLAPTHVSLTTTFSLCFSSMRFLLDAQRCPLCIFLKSGVTMKANRGEISTLPTIHHDFAPSTSRILPSVRLFFSFDRIDHTPTRFAIKRPASCAFFTIISPNEGRVLLCWWIANPHLHNSTLPMM